MLHKSNFTVDLPVVQYNLTMEIIFLVQYFARIFILHSIFGKILFG